MRYVWGVLGGIAVCSLAVGAVCLSDADCPAGTYCQRGEGQCDQPGRIVPKPAACPPVWDPVCGCDGRTYANACTAALFGVSLAHHGPCPVSFPAVDPNETTPPGGEEVFSEQSWQPEPLPRGARILMIDPNAAADDVHTGPSGVRRMRILWDGPVLFDGNDLYVEDEHGQPVDFSVTGSGTALMTVTFARPLIRDRFTVYVFDSVYDPGDLPIDGDHDGVAGGTAILTLEHRARADFNNDNVIDTNDIARMADLWMAEAPTATDAEP